MSTHDYNNPAHFAPMVPFSCAQPPEQQCVSHCGHPGCYKGTHRGSMELANTRAYAAALQKIIECHYRDGIIPAELAALCPFHAHKLNERQEEVKALREYKWMYESLNK